MRLCRFCLLFSLSLALLGACDSDPTPADAGDAAVERDGSTPDGGPGLPDGASPDTSDTTPPTPSSTPPTVEAGPGGTEIGFERPTDADYAGTLVVRATGAVRPTELPPAGEARAVGDTVGAGQVVAVLAATESTYADTESEGDVCWSLFGFDAAFNYVDLGGECLAGVDLTAPAALAGFGAVAGGEWVALSWDAPAADAVRLRVVSSVGADPTDAMSGTVVCDPCAGQAFDVLGLTAGDPHHFAAYAYDAAGNESAPSRGTATVGAVARAFVAASLPDDDLFGATVAADGTEFAVGRNGVVLRRRTGTRWEELPRPTSSVIGAVWASSATDAWLTSGTTSLFRWDGTAYTTVSTPAIGLLTCFWGNGPSDLYAAGSGASIVHWDGTSWTSIADFNDIGGDQQIQALYAPSADRIFASGSEGTIYTWNGATWSITDTGASQVRGLWGSSASNVFAQGPIPGWRYDGTSWAESAGMPNARDTDGAGPNDVKGVWFGSVTSYDGTGWTFDALPGSADGEEIVHVGGGEWIVVGEGGSIWRLRPGGEWELESGGSGDSLLAISGAPDDSLVLAAGGSNTVMERTGGGFVAIFGGSTSSRLDVDVASDSAAVVVGSSRSVLLWDGTSWMNRTENQFPNGASIRGVWTRSATDYWMIGSGVVHRIDAGVDAYADIGFTGSQQAIFGFSNTDVWAGGGATLDAGAVSHFDGTSWTPTTGLCGRVFDLHGLSTDDVWAVGANGCVSRWDGAAWSTVDAGVSVNLNAVWVADRRNVYLGGDDGTLLHWDGATFEALTTDTTGAVTGVWATSAANVWLSGTEGAWVRRADIPE